ncbi:hypothetical protein [Streptomyces sp. NPDC048172]|uniref:hypothetical protein n=1 Tax=Streptomyces sp. NPDC048172 TaxID=3365505 RepID=UPI00371FD83A
MDDGRTFALSVGVPLWAVTVASFGFLAWVFVRALGTLVVMAVAGMFGVSLERLEGREGRQGRQGRLRFGTPLLAVAALAVSGAACGLAYCFPAMRALPGSHQFAVLGALACGAPLVAAVRTATR